MCDGNDLLCTGLNSQEFNSTGTWDNRTTTLHSPAKHCGQTDHIGDHAPEPAACAAKSLLFKYRSLWSIRASKECFLRAFSHFPWDIFSRPSKAKSLINHSSVAICNSLFIGNKFLEKRIYGTRREDAWLNDKRTRQRPVLLLKFVLDVWMCLKHGGKHPILSIAYFSRYIPCFSRLPDYTRNKSSTLHQMVFKILLQYTSFLSDLKNHWNRSIDTGSA